MPTTCSPRSRTTKVQRDRLVAGTAALGLRPVPSDANFVLVGGFDDERAAWQALLERGVLVRDVGLAGHLRITAGTRAETTAVLDALAALRSSGGGPTSPLPWSPTACTRSTQPIDPAARPGRPTPRGAPL